MVEVAVSRTVAALGVVVVVTEIVTEIVILTAVEIEVEP